MGARAEFTGGQLCIDLANLEMSAEQQQELLLAVQTTVVKHLASRSTKVVAISLSPNNGYKPLDEPERPDNDKPYEPDREQPEPDKKPPPPKESAGRR